ncbi:hypothetical protein QYF36_003719 [Acer negundo]|nr:hypothetical protein QYF36_003719 [Acer negundo]
MDNQTVNNVVDADAESEDISESFLCCICLDLLYKPIVLSCGHISCFWCVHKSMSIIYESHCPICRHTYNHFPSICLMLHLLLSKINPIAYKRREKQILEEEKTMGSFSPQFDSHSCQPLLDHMGNSAQSFTIVNESTSEGGIHENNGTTIPVQSSGGTVAIMEKNSPKNKLNGNRKQIAVTDVLCSACKQLLIHPVALNCGHVYCETCIIKQTDEKIRCQICLCLNPKGCPKVCLELDRLLEEQFSKEYALRKDAIQPNKVQSNHESATTCSMEAGKLGFNASFLSTGEQLPMWADPRSKIYFGVGCDYCGMYPIIGDRYKCKDCMEAVGFDLCGDCYNTRSKLPGRFNQKHTQEHKLELVKPIVIHNVMRGLMTGQLEDGSSALILANDIFAPVSDDVQPQENTSNTDNIIEENESEPAS